MGSPPGHGRAGLKAHVGKVQASVWDEQTIRACRDTGVILLQRRVRLLVRVKHEAAYEWATLCLPAVQKCLYALPRLWYTSRRTKSLHTERTTIDILEQVRTNYGSFNRPRQRISDFILNHPEQYCFLSLRSLTQQAGTTEITVLNFRRGPGFGSYMNLRKTFQDYLVVRVNAGDRLKLAVVGNGSIQDLYQRVCHAEREVLQSTLDGNSVELLLAFTQALRWTRRIFIAAHGFSRFPVGYLEHRLFSLELDCRILDLQARQDMFQRLSAQPPQDRLLITIIVLPYGNDTIALTHCYVSIGMLVAALTDRPDSPVARCAQTTLLCHVELMGITNSFTSMIGLVDTLVVLYTFTSGASTQEEKTCRDTLHRELDSCLSGPNTSVRI